VPQEPQFAGSICVNVHPPPHIVSPMLHVATHPPREQSWPLVQTLPHEPQLFGSVTVVTQTPAHTICPRPHIVPQVPRLQTSPVAHA
jgi:hypothetical protein